MRSMPSNALIVHWLRASEDGTPWRVLLCSTREPSRDDVSRRIRKERGWWSHFRVLTATDQPAGKASLLFPKRAIQARGTTQEKN